MQNAPVAKHGSSPHLLLSSTPIMVIRGTNGKGHLSFRALARPYSNANWFESFPPLVSVPAPVVGGHEASREAPTTIHLLLLHAFGGLSSSVHMCTTRCMYILSMRDTLARTCWPPPPCVPNTRVSPNKMFWLSVCMF